MSIWILALTVALAGLVFLQALAQRRARQTEGRAAPDTSAVDGPAHADPVRVYYFHAQHCGPCRAMTPRVDRIAATRRNLIKVDVAQWSGLARDFGIAATPSFVRVRAGLIERVRLGGLSEAELQGLLDD